VRTWTSRLVIAAGMFLFLFPLGRPQGNAAWANPFEMRIVDYQGRPLSGLTIKSDNGIICRTRPDGSVRWTETSLMHRDVRFRIDVAHTPTDVTARVTPGGRVQLSVIVP
jgi:hypothetical protein